MKQVFCNWNVEFIRLLIYGVFLVPVPGKKNVWPLYEIGCELATTLFWFCKVMFIKFPQRLSAEGQLQLLEIEKHRDFLY